MQVIWVAIKCLVQQLPFLDEETTWSSKNIQIYLHFQTFYRVIREKLALKLIIAWNCFFFISSLFHSHFQCLINCIYGSITFVVKTRVSNSNKKIKYNKLNWLKFIARKLLYHTRQINNNDWNLWVSQDVFFCFVLILKKARFNNKTIFFFFP